MMKTSLNKKGQTVQWHTLFFQTIWYYRESVHFLYQCNLSTCAELLIYYNTRSIKMNTLYLKQSYAQASNCQAPHSSFIYECEHYVSSEIINM